MKRMPPGALLAALAIFVCLAAYLLHDGRRGVLTLGYVSSLSGRYSALSGSGRDGAALAVDVVNESGGVAGRTLRLIVVDDGFDEERASAAVADLAGQGVSAIVGPFASAMAAPMIEAAGRYGVLILSPSVSSDVFSGKKDLFLRMIPSTASCSRALGEYMAGQGGRRALSMLVDRANSVYTESTAAFIKEGFTRAGGGQAHVYEYDSRKSPSFKALAVQALAGQTPEGTPDVVLMIASPLDTALFCQHLRMADPLIPIFSSTWGMSSEMIGNGGRSVNGLESVVPFNPSSSNPAYLEFARRYRERYGHEPDYTSAFNYEAVMLLAKALSEHPAATGERLRDILVTMGRQEGLQGPFELDQHGDVSRPLFLLTVEDGIMKAQDLPRHE